MAQPGKIDLGRTISESELKNLPLVSRNPYNFAFLQANVTGYENNEFGVPRINANGTQMHTNYQIDGNTNTQKDRAGLRLLPISEVVVREVKVITSGFAPEFGQTTGMVFNAVTPSGTNDVHGYLTYRYRRAGLTERPFFLSPTARKPDNNIDNVTATLGGPIVPDKWHYYAGYEYVDQDLRDATRVIAAERGQQRPAAGPLLDRHPRGRRHPHRAARQLRDRQDRLPALPRAQALRALLLLQEPLPLQHRGRGLQHRRPRHRLQRPHGLGLRPAHLLLRAEPAERAARAVRAPPPVPHRERERGDLPRDPGERGRRLRLPARRGPGRGLRLQPEDLAGARQLHLDPGAAQLQGRLRPPVRGRRPRQHPRARSTPSPPWTPTTRPGAGPLPAPTPRSCRTWATPPSTTARASTASSSRTTSGSAPSFKLLFGIRYDLFDVPDARPVPRESPLPVLPGGQEQLRAPDRASPGASTAAAKTVVRASTGIMYEPPLLNLYEDAILQERRPPQLHRHPEPHERGRASPSRPPSPACLPASPCPPRASTRWRRTSTPSGRS